MEQQVSKRFYIWSIASGLGLGLLFPVMAIVAFFSDDPDKLRIVLPWFVLGLLAILFSSIVGLHLIYKMWESIQDGYARITPGTAVGFLFIPFYNIYWVFRAVACFPKDYNNFVDRHELSAKKLEPHMFVAFSAFFCR
ncbi:hypothetical protein J7M28_08100 [bacterium]|nr:hypothetical protein [bacterium]